MGRKRANGYNHDKFMARALDDLAEFDAFKDELLPQLRELLKQGASAEDIYRRYEALAAARSVTIVAREMDSGKALAAIKDVLDRTRGKPKERVETTHRLEKLPEEQLDALLLSKLNATEGDEDEGLTH